MRFSKSNNAVFFSSDKYLLIFEVTFWPFLERQRTQWPSLRSLRRPKTKKSKDRRDEIKIIRDIKMTNKLIFLPYPMSNYPSNVVLKERKIICDGPLT